jgi:uncharacterized protein YjaG (DUF416 family)
MSVDGSRLHEELAKVDERLRMAFAAACATRLLPRLQEYCDRLDLQEPPAEAALDLIWKRAAGAAQDPRLRGLITQCEKRCPDDDDGEDDNFHFAQGAVLATVSAGRACLSGDAQDCVWAAVACDDAIEQTLLLDEEADAADENHHWFETEHARQDRDLRELLAGSAAPEQLVAALRSRAEADSKSFPE